MSKEQTKEHKRNCQMSAKGWAASVPPECTCSDDKVISNNFMQVGNSHCYKCHKTFPPDFSARPHTFDCVGEIRTCKNWDGKDSCEFSQQVEQNCSCKGKIRHKWSIHNSRRCYIDPKFEENWELEDSSASSEKWIEEIRKNALNWIEQDKLIPFIAEKIGEARQEERERTQRMIEATQIEVCGKCKHPQNAIHYHYVGCEALSKLLANLK